MAIETRILYQTLQDRGNPDEVELHGPYKCTKEAWFGDGYYFWDTFIQLAHWWGKIGYSSKYMIGKMVFPYDPSNFFDITGANIEQLLDFHEFIKNYFGSLNASYTVAQAIEIMKKRTDLKNKYHGIRGRGIHKIDIDEDNIPLKHGKKYRFELFPPNQICFFDNASFSKTKFKIIWPEKYFVDEIDMSEMTI